MKSQEKGVRGERFEKGFSPNFSFPNFFMVSK